LIVPPFMFGGTMIRWTMFVSWTSPMIVPGETWSPAFASALNSHFLSRGMPGAETPRSMNEPIFSIRTSSGRWIPS